MPVTDGQIARAYSNGRFKPETIEESDLSGGQFSEVSLAASTSGVLAYIEVGQDPPLADAEAVLLGQFVGADGTRPGGDAGDKFLAGQTRVSRVEARIRTSGASDAQSSARFGIGAQKKPEVSTDNALSLRKYGDYDPNSVSSTTDIPVVEPTDMALNGGLPFVTAGEYVTWVVNPGSTGSETYDHDESSSTFTLPCSKWDGTGV